VGYEKPYRLATHQAGSAMSDKKPARNGHVVASVVWKGHFKKLRIEPSGRWLTVPLSACVSEGDDILLRQNEAWVLCKNGQSKFLEPYFEWETLELGSHKLPVAIKEVTEEEEYTAYNSLAEFHYRGQAIHGRTARLIIRTFDASCPKVIGYIELATPFYMNKARARVLDAPFALGGVKWQRWDMATLRRYIHVIVRIARTVVYPEFRGLGVGQTLVTHAARFANSRWQVSGYLPLFLEISADMLKYVPFAEHAGMLFVGETEGNLHRVAKDMDYLIRRFGSHRTGQTAFEDSCGICDQQVARKDRVLRLMESQGLTREEIVHRLAALSKEAVLKDFAFFHEIVTLPKPHYMLGLRPGTRDFLRKRVEEVAPKNGRTPPSVSVPKLDEAISLQDVSISFTSRVRRTQTTNAVQQAFGISPDDLRSEVIRRLSFSIEPGKITLIVGPSGSGKTSLLRAVASGATPPNSMDIQGGIKLPKNASFGEFTPTRSRKPLIEILGAKDIRYSLYLLGLAGLSEPFLYLKRFDELSAGQKYRAMLAFLLAAENNVWLADEFCTNLDPVTANVVAHSVQSIARKTGATVLAAAPHYTNFVFSLRPDIVVRLSSAWEHTVMSGKDFGLTMSKGSAWNGNPPSLRLLPELISEVRKGKKRASVRAGRKWFEAGLLILQSDRESLPVRVTETLHKRFSDLTCEDAMLEGLNDVESLQHTLRCIYPKLGPRSIITVVRFEPLSGEHTRDK
jgi:ABC-type lipoprotein export system ATPase subunit/GNAT superfamily N-acetyltransferase